MELCYVNNPKSLFRKYPHIVTRYAREVLGKNVSLWLPNGYIESDERQARLTAYSRAINSQELSTSLTKIDIAREVYPDLSSEDLYQMLLIDKGARPFTSYYPQVLLEQATINPDADPESTTVDGRLRRSIGNPGETISTLRAGNGTDASDSGATQQAPVLQSSTTTNQYVVMARLINFFDTSAIGSGSTIDSATLSLYATGKDDDNFNQSIGVVEATAASNTALAASDYQSNVSQTTLQATAVDLGSITTSAYNDFVLNATGLGNISKSGITKFGEKFSADYNDSAPSWTSFVADSLTFDQADGTNAPKLVVNYSVPGGYFYMSV